MDMEVVISGPHERRLRELLFPATGYEAGALILFGTSDISRCPWSGEPRRKYLSHKVIEIPASDVVATSPHQFSWRKQRFLAAYRSAGENDLAIGFVHSHRTAPAYFSEDDDRNDTNVAELISHRQGRKPEYLSLVFDEEGGVVARRVAREIEDCSRVVVLGDEGWSFSANEADEWCPETHARQALAFDESSVRVFSTLRVGVVGAGATGSTVLSLLPRLGVRRLAIIDPDFIEKSNVSRVHGSTLDDAEWHRAKVEVAQRHIESMGFELEVVTHRAIAEEPQVRDTLRSCDVMFGCTDDHSGRLFLNRFAMFYHVPLIDMGFKIDPRRTRTGRLQLADGRVTVVTAGTHCLACRVIANPITAAEEDLQRADPNEYGRRVAEGYVSGGNVDNPAVVTFTTEVPCMAVDELTARITCYRERRDNCLRQFAVMRDRSPGVSVNTECGVCDEKHWGRGDVVPFLDRVGMVT